MQMQWKCSRVASFVSWNLYRHECGCSASIFFLYRVSVSKIGEESDSFPKEKTIGTSITIVMMMMKRRMTTMMTLMLMTMSMMMVLMMMIRATMAMTTMMMTTMTVMSVMGGS